MVKRKKEAEEATHCDVSLDALMSAEDVRKIRGILGMSQQEFAILLGVTALTITSWEREGVTSVRGGSFFLLLTLIALLKQAQQFPDFISPERLKALLKRGTNYQLISQYREFSEMMTDDYYSLINMGMLTGVMAAMLFDAYLEKKGLRADGGEAGSQPFSVDELQG